MLIVCELTMHCVLLCMYGVYRVMCMIVVSR